MPRCYMVKKDPSPLGGTPPCSPTEASVALRVTRLTTIPPWQVHGQLNTRNPASRRNPVRRTSQWGLRREKWGREHHPRGPVSRLEPDRDGYFTVLRSTEFYEPRSGDYAEPRTVRYLERDLSNSEPRAAEYAEPRPKSTEEAETLTDYNQRYEAHVENVTIHVENIAENVHVESGHVESELLESEHIEECGKTIQYAELGAAVIERSAADTEAAHELLSLAASVPPLPPATVLTVLGAPEPVLPVYTYSLHPAATSIYIIADEPANQNVYATAVQTLAPLQQVEYSAPPQVGTYITYQEPVPSVQFTDAAEVTPLGVPVSVIEAVPSCDDQPLSVQVPVIEAVPHTPAPETYDTDSDEPTTNCNRKNKYNCNECGKRYATSSNLSRHKQTHRSLDSQAAKRCGECGKAYVSMPALAMHVLTHRMGYVCGVCGKQFSRPWLLRGHLRSHTGEKPYNCPSCSKSFADRSNLRAHLQTHTQDKRWECSRCNKTFALKSYLNKHQEAACSQDDQD